MAASRFAEEAMNDLKSSNGMQRVACGGGVSIICVLSPSVYVYWHDGGDLLGMAPHHWQFTEGIEGCIVATHMETGINGDIRAAICRQANVVGGRARLHATGRQLFSGCYPGLLWAK